jgi:hypothetical protein
MIFDIVKYVIAMVVFGIMVAIIVWVAISYPWQDNTVWSFAFITAFTVFGLGVATRNNIRRYMSLRSQFYDLSENPSLAKAKSIMEVLEAKELIYA